MIKDEEVYPVGTIVIIETGQYAMITDRTFLMDGKNFLHYLGRIEGKGDREWCLFHQRITLVSLPPLAYIPPPKKYMVG